MDRTRRYFACAFLAVLGSRLCAAPPEEGSAKVLAGLRAGHPRLIALQSDVDRVKRLVAGNEEARSLHDRIIKNAKGILGDPPVEHKLVGPRLLSQSRACLTRVYALATAYRLGGDERFARRAEKEMLTAAAFPDWNPSHFLDTAEMTHALGIGYDWLYDVLSAESRERIRTAIIEKGLLPARRIYEKQAWWAKARHNWNQVCNGGITVGALAIADEAPDLASYIIEQASRSIRIPFAELAPDGGWAEGPGYWGYAMAYTAYFLAASETALGTDFGLVASPGFRETGLFRIYGISPANLTFNYADGGSGVGNAPAMLYFAHIFDNPVYAWHERRLQRSGGPLDLWWYDTRGTDAEAFALPLDARFKNVNVAFMRSDWKDPGALFLGFKGGDNKANHSHLDLGSFVLDALGQRWAVDLGPDDYNMPGYFGKQRWTYYRLRTESHNTLLINGKNQNPAAAAPITAFKSDPERALAVADLSAAYASEVRSVRRGVMMIDRNRVLVQDEVESETPVDLEWGLLTGADVRIESDRVRLTQRGKTMTLSALESGGGRWDVREVTLDPPQRPLKDTRRVSLRLRTSKPLTRLAVLFAPEGQSKASVTKVEPLSTWVAGK